MEREVKKNPADSTDLPFWFEGIFQAATEHTHIRSSMNHSPLLSVRLEKCNKSCNQAWASFLSFAIWSNKTVDPHIPIIMWSVIFSFLVPLFNPLPRGTMIENPSMGKGFHMFNFKGAQQQRKEY